MSSLIGTKVKLTEGKNQVGKEGSLIIFCLFNQQRFFHESFQIHLTFTPRPSFDLEQFPI